MRDLWPLLEEEHKHFEQAFERPESSSFSWHVAFPPRKPTEASAWVKLGAMGSRHRWPCPLRREWARDVCSLWAGLNA